MSNRTLPLASALVALVAVASGQSTPSCTVNTDTVTPSCTGSGWYSGLTHCQHRTIGCTAPPGSGATIANLGITFGYTTPSSANGTIVFFGPEGGTTPSDPHANEATYAAYYAGAPNNYQVVQTQWDSGSGSDSNSDWEDTGTTTKNVAYAAGRPAAFLSWVNTNLYAPIHAVTPTAGFCAQGNSAGGGAIAYYLAWYGGYASLDHAEFLSSPPLSDLEQGCLTQNPHSLYTPVTVCPTGQMGCNPSNNPSSWTQFAIYTDAVAGVREWSDDASQGAAGVCQGSTTTSATANSEWKAMSIVDGTVGTFSYPQTSMTVSLCSSVWSPDGLDDGVSNNSSTQAQLFFQNFTNSSQLSQPSGLLIDGVVGCNGPEDVTNASPDPQLTVIERDMVGKCVSHLPANSYAGGWPMPAPATEEAAPLVAIFDEWAPRTHAPRAGGPFEARDSIRLRMIYHS